MKKPFKMIAHVSYHIYELENTGELGKQIDPATMRSLNIHNKIIDLGSSGSPEELAKRTINIEVLK